MKGFDTIMSANGKSERKRERELWSAEEKKKRVSVGEKKSKSKIFFTYLFIY